MPYTPSQVSEMLDIPPSTLRRYAAVYSDHLSPQQPKKKRTYNDSDIMKLRRIKELSGHIPPEEIPAHLDRVSTVLVEKPTAAASSSVMLLPEVYARFDRLEADHQHTLSEMHELSARLERLEASTAQSERLRAWAALPWWRRLFTPPPTE